MSFIFDHLITAAGNSGCDGITAQLTGPTGEFGTTGPQYQNEMSCSWKITVPVGMVGGCMCRKPFKYKKNKQIRIY